MSIPKVKKNGKWDLNEAVEYIYQTKFADEGPCFKETIERALDGEFDYMVAKGLVKEED